jgi:hypothetical protein
MLSLKISERVTLSKPSNFHKQRLNPVQQRWLFGRVANPNFLKPKFCPDLGCVGTKFWWGAN